MTDVKNAPTMDGWIELLGTGRYWWYVIDCNPFGDPRQPKWEIRKIHGSAYVWSGSRFATFDAARLHAIGLVEQWRQSPYASPRRIA